VNCVKLRSICGNLLTTVSQRSVFETETMSVLCKVNKAITKYRLLQNSINRKLSLVSNYDATQPVTAITVEHRTSKTSFRGIFVASVGSKVQPTTDYEGPKEEMGYNSMLSLTTALDEGG
jgi:hypothetical protein